MEKFLPVLKALSTSLNLQTMDRALTAFGSYPAVIETSASSPTGGEDEKRQAVGVLAEKLVSRAWDEADEEEARAIDQEKLGWAPREEEQADGLA